MLKVLTSGLIMGVSLLQIACSVFGVRSEETPSYKVIRAEGNKEIREYSSYIVAKTTVKGDFKEVQGEAFRILAAYIFGSNERKEQISMTAPVIQQRSSEGEKIAMTAPVVQSPTAEGWVMTFSMPSKYTMKDLPAPKDKKVLLEEVPAKTIAAIRFSGFWTASNINKKAEELKSWIEKNPDYEITFGPSFAGYDPPWTIPFFRRNEMMFEVRRKNN